MDFASLHHVLMEKLDYRALFVHLGLQLASDPDADGWVTCPSIFAPGKHMRINITDGGWMDELTHPELASVYDFIIAIKKLPDGHDGNIAALKFLCEFAGMADDFKRCDQPPPPKPGAIDPIRKDTIDAWRKALTQMRERLESLTGLNVKTMQRYNLGWVTGKHLKAQRGAFIIPVADYDGVVRSARLVDEDLEESRWAPKHIVKVERTDRSPKLYGVDEIYAENWSTVVICQNEFDRLIMMQERERHEWGAVSTTDDFLPHWTRYLEGRAVVLCFHSDKKSRSYAECVVAPMLKREKEKSKILSLKVVHLPTAGLPADKSIVHWFKAGGTWKTFQQMAESAPEWIPPNNPDGHGECKILGSFSEIDDPINSDLKVQVPLCVSGETNIVYDSPTEFSVSYCDWIDKGRCELCVDKTFPIPIGRPEHIASYNSSDANREKVCRDICCPMNQKPKIKILKKSTFRVVHASQYVNRIVDRENTEKPRLDGRYEQMTERLIYVRIPEGRSQPLEPRGYTATGWVTTNPKNGERTLLVESLTPLEEGHESFKLADHSNKLIKLREMGWQAIVKDLTEHVTRIYGYDELLLITLLTYCSPLWISFNKEIIRGWLTAAVIGDSGVGKSKVFERISEYIGVGDIFSCLTGRRTGLTYSIVKTAKSWRCQSGMQPRNSRKILCVEEAQDMPQRDIKSMAIAMDTGRMDVEGVARGSYETQTRLIFNCNAASERTLQSYSYGCLASKDLFSHMFIRRLDLAAFIRRMENGNDHYNRVNTSTVGKIRPEELRALVYYAWNLTSERVRIEDNVTQLILQRAKTLSEIYGACDDIPLVCPSDFRNTIARVATAWAILDLSTSDDLYFVNVTEQHVRNAEALFTSLYSSQDCALDEYSNLSRRQTRLEDYSIIESEMAVRINAQAREAIAGRSPFPRLMFLLNRGLRYTKDELRRLLATNEAFIVEATQFLASHHLISVGSDDKVYPTPKYTRFFKRFNEAHPDLAAIVNLAADQVDVEAVENDRE